MSLRTAFAELRKKHKLIARQSFWCCRSCAGNALSNEIEAMPKHERPKGYVTFTKQDAVDLREHGKVHVSYGAFAHTKVPTKAFGELAREVFAAHGCPVDWSGDGEERLLVWRDENTRREHALKMLGRVA